MGAENRLASPSTEDLTSLSRAKGFLAREFLLWLWWRSESEDFAVEVKSTAESGRRRTMKASVWIDDRVVLESPSGQIHEHIMKGGTPAQSIESAEALATGKTVKEIKIGLAVEGLGDFSAVLDGESLSPRGLKLPAPDSDATAVSADGTPSRPRALPVSARLDLIDVFVCFLDQLFATFMEERTVGDWSNKGGASIRKWIRTRRVAATNTVH